MKRTLALITAVLLSALALFGCSDNSADDLNASKISPSQSVLQKYPGLKGEYYADGKTAEKSTEKLINDVIPNILKDEITKHDGVEVNTLKTVSSEISNYDNGDVATLVINAVLNNGEPMDRTVLVFIKTEPTESGYRSYFLNYHNMDQTDIVDDEEKQQMLEDSLAQMEIVENSEEASEVQSDYNNDKDNSSDNKSSDNESSDKKSDKKN